MVRLLDSGGTIRKKRPPPRPQFGRSRLGETAHVTPTTRVYERPAPARAPNIPRITQLVPGSSFVPVRSQSARQLIQAEQYQAARGGPLSIDLRGDRTLYGPTSRFGLTREAPGDRPITDEFGQPGVEAGAVRKMRKDVLPGNRTIDELWRDYYRDAALAKALDQWDAENGKPNINRYQKYLHALSQDSTYKWLLTHGGGVTEVEGRDPNKATPTPIRVKVPRRMENILTAQAMGFPVSDEWLKDYVKDAFHIMKQGVSPEKVPGIVLGPGSAVSIARLKAFALQRGFHKDEVKDANFGQLIGMALGPAQYAKGWKLPFEKPFIGGRGVPGGRFIPTVWQNTPGSVGRNIEGIPQGLAMIGGAVASDLSDAVTSRIDAIKKGDWGNLKPDPHFTSLADAMKLGRGARATSAFSPLGLLLNAPIPAGKETKPVAESVIGGQADLYKSLLTHPAETIQKDPFAGLTAAWSLVYPAAGIGGRVALARGWLNPVRQFNLSMFPNRGRIVEPATTGMPKFPQVWPGQEPLPDFPTGPITDPLVHPGFIGGHHPDFGPPIDRRVADRPYFGKERRFSRKTEVAPGQFHFEGLGPAPFVEMANQRFPMTAIQDAEFQRLRNEANQGLGLLGGTSRARRALPNAKQRLTAVGEGYAKIQEYEKKIRNLAASLKNAATSAPTGRAWARVRDQIQTRLDDAKAELAKTEPGSIEHQVAQNMVDMFDAMLVRHRDVGYQNFDARKEIRKQIEQTRELLRDVHEEMVHHHIQLGLPHPSIPAEIKRLQAEAAQLFRNKAPEADQIAVRQQIEHLKAVHTGADPLEPYLTAMADMHAAEFTPPNIQQGFPRAKIKSDFQELQDSGNWMEWNRRVGNGEDPYLRDPETGDVLERPNNLLDYVAGLMRDRFAAAIDIAYHPQSAELAMLTEEAIRIVARNLAGEGADHLLIPSGATEQMIDRVHQINRLVPKIKQLAQQHLGKGFHDFQLEPTYRPNYDMQIRLRGLMQDIQKAIAEDHKTAQFNRTQAAAIAKGKASGALIQRLAGNPAAPETLAQQAARLKLKKFLVATTYGLKVAWANTKTDAAKLIADLEPDALIREVQQVDKGNGIQRGEPTVQDFVYPEEVPKPGEPIDIEFQGSRIPLVPPPHYVLDPTKIVHILDDLKDYPEIVRSYRNELQQEADRLEAKIAAADKHNARAPAHQQVDVTNDINVHHRVQSALDRINEHLDKRLAVPVPAEDVLAVPGEQLELYTPGQLAKTREPGPGFGGGGDTETGTDIPSRLGIPRGNLDLTPQRRRTVLLGGTINDPLTIYQGVYAKNLIDRFVQKLQDRLLTTERPLFGATRAYQEHFITKQYMKDQGRARRAFYIRREQLVPLLNKANALKQDEVIASLQAHLQGLTPTQMLRFWQRRLADTTRLDKRAALGKDILRQAKLSVPRGSALNNMRKMAEDASATELVDWLDRYRGYLKNEDYLDDEMFSDVIRNYFEPSKDLQNQVALWTGIVKRIGDEISPEMDAFMREARLQSKMVDDAMARANVIPKHILDERRYNRQNLVRAVLHDENIQLDPKAIYVGDRATTTHPGDFVFRRSSTYDPGVAFRGRFKKHRGLLLMEGQINPSFGTYYSGLTSALSKIDAIKLQRSVLERYGHKVLNRQLSYDADKFVLYDAKKGVFYEPSDLRKLMGSLNKRMGEDVQHDMMLGNEQNVRFRDPRRPGESNLQDLYGQDLLSAQHGDLWLVTRALSKRMKKPVTSHTLNNPWVRLLLTKPTQFFRKIALFVRPAYLVINSAESYFRAWYFGGVGPVSLARAAVMGRKFAKDPELKKALIPEWVQRSTYAGDVRRSQHLGGGEVDKLALIKQQWHETNINIDRAAHRFDLPFFGNPVSMAKYMLGLKWSDQILNGTARVENYLREAVILRGQLKAAKRYRYGAADPRRYFKGMDDHMQNLMVQIAKDKPFDARMYGEMDAIIKNVTRVLGDFSHGERAKLAAAFPFYRWVAFITKFVLWESPVHYPGRTTLLQTISRMGYDELQKMGVLPPNIQGALPISGLREEKDPQGRVSKVVSLFYTQAWNGMSTVPQLFGVNAVTGTSDPWAGVAHQLNPFLQAAFAAFARHDLATLRQLKDPRGNDLKYWSGMNFLQLGIGHMLQAFWPLMIGYDFNEQADTAIPFFHKVMKQGDNVNPYEQPQSSQTEQLVAAMTGFRRRNYNLTTLQTKNIVDAMHNLSQVFKAIDDPKAQALFKKQFDQSVITQLQYLNEWAKDNGDPSTWEGWNTALTPPAPGHDPLAQAQP